MPMFRDKRGRFFSIPVDVLDQYRDSSGSNLSASRLDHGSVFQLSGKQPAVVLVVVQGASVELGTKPIENA